MRNIKFRVWDKYKKYFNSDYAINDNLVYGACEGEIIKEKEHLVFMQWTGLTDKNGKEIYEGDIVRDSTEEVSSITEVKWNCACFEIHITHGHGLMGGSDTCGIRFGYWTEESMKKLEVIGNIFEYPHLL
jgi:uncharacterized phage protein (TIGR01671 family)